MDTQQQPTRVCSQCGQEKSIEEFYIKVSRTGRRHSWCRQCQAAYSAARYAAAKAARPPREKPIIIERTCTHCKRTLPLEQFPIKSTTTGQRRAVCRECHNAKNAAFKRENAEQTKASRLDYYQRNREEVLERLRRYREEHPEADRATHSKWKANNKSAVNAATHRRRSKIKGNGGDGWTAAQWEALKAEYDYACLMCGRQEPDIQLHADHIVPVQYGGTNDIDNIQPLCKSCNSRKHTHTLDLRLLWRMTHPKGEPT